MTLHNLLVETNALLHVSCTGAGASLQQQLWDTPGASKYLVGSHFPYARTQLCDFIGIEPEASFCSKEVALEMAMASYIQACEHKLRLSLDGEPVGLGISASVASTRIPRGDHRAHIAIVTKEQVAARILILEKGKGLEQRRQHDQQVTHAALYLLIQVLRGEPQEDETDAALDLLFQAPVFDSSGLRCTSVTEGVFLPASLNPIHDGHRLMAQAAEEKLKRPVVYLVATSTPHKPPMRLQEMLSMVGMLRGERWNGQARALEFTRGEPLFIDKVRARPNSCFVIGADTMDRFLDPKWGPEIELMLQEMRQLGAMFYVMGRKIGGIFKTCRDIDVPFPHQLLFRPLEGRIDVSSTEIRQAEAS